MTDAKPDKANQVSSAFEPEETSDNNTLDNTVDRITEKIGILTRRETEARILIPVIQDLARRFGKAPILDSISDTIVRIARDQGEQLAETMGANGPAAFQKALAFWTRDNALEIEIKEVSETCLAFDVTRCRYAEMYKALGARELGALFSCNRDAALIRGFNPGARMKRTRTIMDGHPVCDFVYTFPAPEKTDPDEVNPDNFNQDKTGPNKIDSGGPR